MRRRLERLGSRLASDDAGFSLVEVIVATLIGAMLLTVVAVFVVSAMKTGAFTEGQSRTIDDARTAMGRIEKEIRGADSITWCATDGTCLEVGAQRATGGFRPVRYTHSANELRRQEFVAATSTWSQPQTIVERVQNTPAEPVFVCATGGTLLRVDIDLRLQATPSSDPTYNIYTSIRPRNFPETQACPS